MKKKCYPMRFAHRGLVQYAPENTLGAFEAAVEYGCEGIELDLRASKDGEPMVVHDGNLRRITDGVITDDVCDLTCEEIQKAVLPYAGHLLPHDPPVPYSENLGSVAQYTEEELAEQRRNDKRTTHISTFYEFDKWFETVEADITIEIELCSVGLMPRLYEILSASENCSRYIVFSGNKDVNAELQGTMKEKGKPESLRLGANIRRLTDENLSFVKTADLYEVGLNDKWFTKEDSDLLADMGIKVFSNLGDYPEWWSEMRELGIEAFKTNYAEAYTEWLENNGL